MEPSWLRRLRGGFMKPSWSLRGASVVARGATMVASWSLRGALAPPVIRQIITGPGMFRRISDQSTAVVTTYNATNPNEYVLVCMLIKFDITAQLDPLILIFQNATSTRGVI